MPPHCDTSGSATGCVNCSHRRIAGIMVIGVTVIVSPNVVTFRFMGLNAFKMCIAFFLCPFLQPVFTRLILYISLQTILSFSALTLSVVASKNRF